MMTVTLAREDAPRAARRLVADGCARAATGPVCAEAAAVITSELVTNAVVHGAGLVTFGMEADQTVVRVQVGDADPRTPRVTAAGDEAEGGRGMIIVNSLAAAWGVLADPPGKIVWFEVYAQP